MIIENDENYYPGFVVADRLRVGRNRLYRVLRKAKIFDGENLPTKKYQKLFKVKRSITGIGVISTVLFSEKAIIFIETHRKKI